MLKLQLAYGEPVAVGGGLTMIGMKQKYEDL